MCGTLDGTVKAVVLVNRSAGSARAGPELTAEGLAERFATHGVDALVRFVASERIESALRESLRDPADALVVGAGDGTLGVVAGMLAGGRTPLGVLPLGTFNHFARDNSIPLSLEEAVRCIAAGHTEPTDVAEVNGHAFVNNSSIGAYAFLVEERESSEHSGASKHLAAALAVVRVLRHLPLLRVRLELPGERIDSVTPLVFVGNNEYTGSLLGEHHRRRLDEGKLSVFAAHNTGALGLVKLIVRSAYRRPENARDFVVRTTTELRVHSGRRRLRVARDGEVLHLSPPLQYRIRPGVLRVLRPPRAPGESA